METGKLCFSVSVGVAYGTGQIVTVKGERVEISARKYYPYLDWLKAERTVWLINIYIVMVCTVIMIVVVKAIFNFLATFKTKLPISKPVCVTLRIYPFR